MEAPEKKDPGTGPQSISSLFQTDKPPVDPAELEAAANTESDLEQPKKKKYYSPNEVMKKKGCIGCGGMALATLLMAALALALALI